MILRNTDVCISNMHVSFDLTVSAEIGARMTDLRQLAKEEVVKNVIDKLIFGLMAALIIFGVQYCSDKNTRKQIEKEAILKLESNLIINEAKILQSQLSEYLFLISKTISLGFPLTDEDKNDLLAVRVRIESSLEVLTTHDNDLKTKSSDFIDKIIALNTQLGRFDALKSNEYKESLRNLKKEYIDLLSSIKLSAIESLIDHP